MERVDMADFLEERISRDIKIGSGFDDQYSVNVVQTSVGNEYRSLIHPFPARTFDVSFLMSIDATYNELLAMWHRAHGMYAGFRIRCYDEYSSNGRSGTPTAFDQPMLLVSTGVYQLVKQYGTSKSAGASGYPYRQIKKPVSGTVKVGIGSTEIRSADWSVVTTTGVVTFAADITKSITGISKAAQAVISFGTTHSFIAGMSVNISGVAGMTQINGQRALIVSAGTNDITVAINSTAYSTWTSGGAVHTRPQTGESVTAGFEFDFPVRFNSSFPVGQDYTGHRNIDSVELIEILNP
jgi:uncharacterized protein (TIGR02217 family)